MDETRPHDAPLILTLHLDDASQARFESLRRAHFPPALNRVPAHVTLFHHLPGSSASAIISAVGERCAATAPFPVTVSGIRFLGRGSAFTLRSGALDRLRADLACLWLDWLTPQDRQPWHPHVTIQNKAAPHLARALFQDLSAEFHPFAAEAWGLALWRYLGGPWSSMGQFPFGHGDAVAAEP